MMKFDFFFGAMLGQTVLSHSDNLSRTLQKGDISASEGQDTAEMTDVSKLYELTLTITLYFFGVKSQRKQTN